MASKDRLEDSLVPDHASVIRHTRTYSCPIFDVFDDEIRLENSDHSIHRMYMEHPDAVGILAVRDSPEDPGNHDVLMIRQYRHPLHTMHWEFPAGLCDHEGESALAAAQRELSEETGYQAQHMEPLVRYASSPGCSTEVLTVFLATELHPVASSFVREDEEAEIEQRWIPLAQARNAVLAGKLISPSVCVGLMAFCTKTGIVE
ncbi:MAG: NUDIX hydrolase [Actinomycetaceae bacterium]|nr:NUDIX hydrolase [Actinomycetaceae bacterium]MDY6083241.1 NUDIX hydrolase [Actinomycetaceae bacterium]